MAPSKYLLPYFIVCLTGCGHNPLGPEKKTISVILNSATQSIISQSVIENAVQWNKARVGEFPQSITIFVKLRPLHSNVLGEADIGGPYAEIYLRQEDYYEDVIAVLFHELDHLRGKTHANMPNNDYYDRMSREFLQAYNVSYYSSSTTGKINFVRPICTSSSSVHSSVKISK